jgi:tape measure domain-containing protein
VANDITWQINAQENISTTIGRITQALAGLDSSDAKTFGQMVQSLSRAQTAATQAQTAMQRLETSQVQTAAASQRLAQAETQSATATQRLATAAAQTAAAQARAAAAGENVTRAHAQAEAAQSRAAQAGIRLSQAQEQAARGYRDVGQAATQHAPAAASFFSNALSAATGFLAANVFSRVASGFGDIIGGVVGASASMEQTRAGFTSLLGSAQAADTLIKQLQAEANKSPFDLESFRKASQLLLGMGVAADDVVPRLHNVSNVVAAVGGGKEQFDRISLALGQIQAKGKLSAEEVNQLAEAGVPAWDLLATAMGKSKAEVIDLAQQGKISAETFNAAFAQFANSDQISQAAERNSHTFNGLLSTIGDIGQALETAFGTPVLAAVEPVLERIVSSLQDPAVVTTLGQWGAAAGQFAVGLIQAGQTAFTVAQQIIQALQPVTDFLGGLLGIQGPTAPAFTPPDFTPAAQSAGQFGAAIQQGATNTKSAKDQVADLERATRELARSTAEANVSYDHRKQSLQDQLTLLDRQYQAENKAADISSLQEKIAKDRALAVDAYSSQGQAAASRLVDEEARLKQLQREQGHDAAKERYRRPHQGRGPREAGYGRGQRGAHACPARADGRPPRQCRRNHRAN